MSGQLQASITFLIAVTEITEEEEFILAHSISPSW